MAFVYIPIVQMRRRTLREVKSFTRAPPTFRWFALVSSLKELDFLECQRLARITHSIHTLVSDQSYGAGV